MQQKHFLDQVMIQLRHYREALGISQVEVAEKLNIGSRSYQRYENGESIPSIDLLFQLSELLKFEIKDLFAPCERLQHFNNIKLATSIEQVDPLLVNQYPSCIFNSPEFQKIHKEGGRNELKQYKTFMDGEDALICSTPKNSLMNRRAQALLGFENEVTWTLNLAGSALEMGLIWACLIPHQQGYLDYTTTLSTSEGLRKVRYFGIFHEIDKNYFLLRKMEVWPES